MLPCALPTSPHDDLVGLGGTRHYQRVCTISCQIDLMGSTIVADHSNEHHPCYSCVEGLSYTSGLWCAHLGSSWRTIATYCLSNHTISLVYLSRIDLYIPVSVLLSLPRRDLGTCLHIGICSTLRKLLYRLY